MVTERNSIENDLLKDRALKINSWNEMLKHLELGHKTHREGWKNKERGLIWWATIPRLERWWMVSGWRENNFHDSITGYLGEGDS